MYGWMQGVLNDGRNECWLKKGRGGEERLQFDDEENGGDERKRVSYEYEKDEGNKR